MAISQHVACQNLLLVRMYPKIVILVNVTSLEDSFYRLLKGSGLVGFLGELVIISIFHHKALHVHEGSRDFAD